MTSSSASSSALCAAADCSVADFDVGGGHIDGDPGTRRGVQRRSHVVGQAVRGAAVGARDLDDRRLARRRQRRTRPERSALRLVADRQLARVAVAPRVDVQRLVVDVDVGARLAQPQLVVAHAPAVELALGRLAPVDAGRVAARGHHDDPVTGVGESVDPLDRPRQRLSAFVLPVRVRAEGPVEVEAVRLGHVNRAAILGAHVCRAGSRSPSEPDSRQARGALPPRGRAPPRVGSVVRRHPRRGLLGRPPGPGPGAPRCARPRPLHPEQGPRRAGALRVARDARLLPRGAARHAQPARQPRCPSSRARARSRDSRPPPGRSATACRSGSGMALAAASNGATTGVVVMMSDGECNEGSVWEAAMMAGAQKRRAPAGDRRLQQAGRRPAAARRSWRSSRSREKFERFGWSAYEVDGHDLAALCERLRRTSPTAAASRSP